MDMNVEKFQDFVNSIYNVFNLSFAMSISSCPHLETGFIESIQDEVIDDDRITRNENGLFADILYTVPGFLYSYLRTDHLPKTPSPENEDHQTECIPVLTFYFDQRFSTYFLLAVLPILFCFLILSSLCLFRFLCQRRVKKEQPQKMIVNEFEIKEEENFTETEIPPEPSNHNSNNSNERVSLSPLRISFPSGKTNHNEVIEKVGIGSDQNKMDTIFDSTLSHFLKQFNNYLGVEVQQFIHELYTSNSSPLSSLSGLSKEMSAQSPRVRRKWSQPQDINPENLFNLTSEKDSRNWMHFEMFCKRMNWSYCNFLPQSLNLERNEDTENLNILLKFLQENCRTKIMEWNVNAFIVNYSLFLLEEMLKITALTDKSNEILQLARFESCGSAANGTLAGKCNHFDVMFVIDFSKSTDLVILHNNYCDEISPGHVVIGMKDVDGRNTLHTSSCLYKGQVKDMLGSFLLCNQIENVVDGMVRKTVNRLNTNHKYKMQRLPFKFKMDATKALNLVIDTSVLNGLGLKVFNVSIRFIPSICIESPELMLLPKLFAVPSWRSDHRKSWEEKNKRVGALTKLFLRGNGPNIPSNLYWNISVSELEAKVRETLEDRFYKSGVQSCYKECLLILKALFSSKSKQTLLNKGEISPFVLSTVVNFLFMESSAASWEISQLSDRVSDAVHFLISSFENVWLPNFIIHNPHLNKKIHALDRLSPLITGRQQNLLADVDANSAMKTLAFIDSRLKETGLSKVVKEEYSEEMWEYEFFLFG